MCANKHTPQKKARAGVSTTVLSAADTRLRWGRDLWPHSKVTTCVNQFFITVTEYLRKIGLRKEDILAKS